MEHQNNSSLLQAQEKNVLHQVTPVSKYLSMFLFIFLPFLGGWIGYSLAPDMVTEADKVIVREKEIENSANEGAETENIMHDLVVKPFNPKSLFIYSDGEYIEVLFLYRSVATGIMYFHQLTYGGPASRIVGYQPEDGSVKETPFYISDFFPSPNGRFIPKMSDYYSPTTSIEIIDLESESKQTITILNNETLWTGGCGEGGPEYNIGWEGNSVLRYGVYSLSALPSEGCDTLRPIEYREIKF